MLGPSIRRLLTEELLIDLQSIDDNDNVASPVVDYMRALRELYHICVTKDLDSNFAKYIFRATSGELVHSSLRRLKELHNLHTKTKIGTKAHMNRLLKSSCLFNFKNEGFKMMKLGVPENVIDEFWSEDNLH